MAANFTATLHRSGAIKFKGLALLEDEILLALKAHLQLEKGFSLRSLTGMFQQYPIISALDVRVSELVKQVKKLPVQQQKGLALSYQPCLQLDSSEGPMEFGFWHELLLQDPSSGQCLQIDASDLASIVDLPIYLGLAEVLHITQRDSYDTTEAVSNVGVSLFSFIMGILDCLYARQPEFGLTAESSPVEDESSLYSQLREAAEGDVS